MTREERKALDTAERLLLNCDQITEIVAYGRSSYEREVRTQWAIEMGLIRLGEEVSRLPENIREEFSGQPWRVIIGLRHTAAHQYDHLRTDRVWKTLTEDIPPLRSYVKDVMLPVLQRRTGKR